MQASGRGQREPAQGDSWAESLQHVLMSPSPARVAPAASLPGLELEILWECHLV